jgi:hypothetical protein
MKTRVVPTKVHGAIDYATAPVLAFAPELFRLEDGKASSLPPRLAGLGGSAIGALSDHELAARRVVPMRLHLALDAATGVVLAALPWVAGSARKGKRYWLPHALVGAADVALALTTETEPGDRRRKLPGARAKRRPLLAGAVGGALLGGLLLARSRGGEPAA